MNNFGHFTSSNLQFEIEQSLKPNQKGGAANRKRSAIKNIIFASSTTMQSISSQVATQSFKISREEFLQEFTEGIYNGGRGMLGKRTEFATLDEIMPRSSKPGSPTTSLGSLPEVSTTSEALFSLRNSPPQLEASNCSLASLEAGSFLKALSSPLESTKALLKHFLYESITSEAFDLTTYTGLSTQVQDLVQAFCSTQFKGLQLPTQTTQLQAEILLEDLLPSSTRLSAQDLSCKRQFKLSVLLGCYMEGLKQQLAKTGKSTDQRAAIRSLYSALYEGPNASIDKDSKQNLNVDLSLFETFVNKLLARTLSTEETEMTKVILTSKLLSKLKKLPKRPLKSEYHSAVSSVLSSLIDGCESLEELRQSMQDGTSDIRVFLLSEICPECRRETA